MKVIIINYIIVKKYLIQICNNMLYYIYLHIIINDFFIYRT